MINLEDRRQVSLLLEEAGFDESAIEAEAYAMVADQLENAHRMLKFNEEGRGRMFRAIAKHQKRLEVNLRRNADRVLADDRAATATSVLVN